MYKRLVTFTCGSTLDISAPTQEAVDEMYDAFEGRPCPSCAVKQGIQTEADMTVLANEAAHIITDAIAEMRIVNDLSRRAKLN